MLAIIIINNCISVWQEGKTARTLEIVFAFASVGSNAHIKFCFIANVQVQSDKYVQRRYIIPTIIERGQAVYVLEFKVVEVESDEVKAIEQIKYTCYHTQYVQAGRKVILIGMDFSKAERNVVGFEWEMC